MARGWTTRPQPRSRMPGTNRWIIRTAETTLAFLLVLRSAANPRAAEILRAGIERHVEKHLTDLLPGRQHADAALTLSVIAGFRLMRTLIGSTELNRAGEDVLRRKLGRVFAVLLAE
ncbi:hypothetical protein [Amycolatopsis sp. cmx-4-61]|uniref:TetR/AcrR family transcriptional regulator n=1 Tax=Amycolatopsis sp. cmx-4-61 TaxID=2790937 RepID=UPI0039784B8E